MNTLNIRWRLVLLIAGIAAIIVIAAVLVITFSHPGTPASENTQNASSTATTTVTGNAPAGNGTSAAPGASPSSGNSPRSAPAAPKPAITINLLTPISGNIWTMGGTNSIAWDRAAGITGEIDLVNANTKAFIGVILSETGPNQTSYSWDGRSIYLARYSPEKKDVTPGTYSIRIRFDGNGLGELVSGPVTIAK